MFVHQKRNMIFHHKRIVLVVHHRSVLVYHIGTLNFTLIVCGLHKWKYLIWTASIPQRAGLLSAFGRARTASGNAIIFSSLKLKPLTMSHGSPTSSSLMNGNNCQVSSFTPSLTSSLTLLATQTNIKF